MSVPPTIPMAASSPTFVGSLAPTLKALARGITHKNRPSERWRSAALALLRLSPKECDAIGLVFEDDCANDVRDLILELLAGAGTFEAQVVMRRLLSLAVAREDRKLYASYVQRLGSVEEPDGPTLRYLMSVYFESRNEPHYIRAACAYALGAAAGQANKAGEVDAAIRATDVLRRDLREASTIQEKCALVTAIGNSGLAMDTSSILQFTADPDGAVRAAATLGLRKIGGSDSRRALIAMLADRELKVSVSAIIALGEQRLETDELERLADLVLGGRTSLDLDARLLGFLSAQRSRSSSAVERALRLLIGRADDQRVSGEREAVVTRATNLMSPLGRRASGSYSIIAPERVSEATLCSGDPNPFFEPVNPR